MKNKIKLSPKALDDIRNGAVYYNEQQKGLGKSFKVVINKTLDEVREMPLSASIVYEDVRYKVVENFPYIILYKIKGNVISVSTVFNIHLRPSY